MTRRTKAAAQLLATIPYCEYCHLPEEIIAHGLWIDHIVPYAKGGTNEADNLCVACVNCNQAKAAHTTACDPATGQVVRLFHPREDTWNEHFRWSPDGMVIDGLTATGRATISALRMNRPKILRLRRLLSKLNMVDIE